jgi:hypothetical protein
MTMKTLNHSEHSEHSESKGLFGICIFAVPAVVKKGLPA